MNELNPFPTDSSSRSADRFSASFRYGRGYWTSLVLLTVSGLGACLNGSSDALPYAFVAGEGPAPVADEPLDESTGDRYSDVGTNPFVMVAHDPLSTFATDADTASYDLFVRDVNAGTLPAPASVRLEDYVNYFAYDYPTPEADAEQPFSVHLAGAPNPLGTGTTLLRVGLQGKAAPAQQPKPANLVFLVDTSGSMQDSNKLPLVQQVLRQTLDQLHASDTVSIVTYASGTAVRLTPTPVSQRDRIVEVIDRLAAGGSTAGASGIELAYAEAGAGFLDGGINHVILCTDGDFNVGPSSNEELLDLITEKRRTGVTLTALGFGSGNLNDSMLEAVSNAGNGFYGFIGSENQAAEYVRTRLLSTLTLIARDVKVQVEFNPNYVQAYRLLGYEDRAIADEDFRNDSVDAGEIGAGHRVTALYELVLLGQPLPAVAAAPAPSDGDAYQGTREVSNDEFVHVKLRYEQVDATETDTALEVSASLAPSALSNTFAEGDLDLRWAFSVAAFAEILKHSPYARPDTIDALGAEFKAQAARDEDRAAFYALFQAARAEL